LKIWCFGDIVQRHQLPGGLFVSRLTITLDDDLHQALKEASARQGRPIGKIIEEGLLLRGIKPLAGARELVARARQQAKLNEEDALALGVAETHSVRS
jgi:hypothetical protein